MEEEKEEEEDTDQSSSEDLPILLLITSGQIGGAVHLRIENLDVHHHRAWEGRLLYRPEEEGEGEEGEGLVAVVVVGGTETDHLNLPRFPGKDPI